MKKFLAVLLVLMTTISLMSCGSPAIQKSEETFGEFEWPSSELIDLLPVPESNFGEIVNEGSDFFYVYVGNTTREQYNVYVDACIANGFTVDYDKDKDHYFASNTDGINLYLRYYEDNEFFGKNILDIGIDRPEDQENTSTDDPATPSSVASPSLQPTASPTESAETIEEPLTSETPNDTASISPSPSPSASNTQTEDSAIIGDFTVSILNCEQTVDYEDNPALRVYFSFTNNGADTQSFLFSVRAQAFQNGVELENAFTLESVDEDNNILKDVKQGASLKVSQIYKLSDNSPVEIEVNTLFKDGTPLTKIFTLE